MSTRKTNMLNSNLSKKDLTHLIMQNKTTGRASIKRRLTLLSPLIISQCSDNDKRVQITGT